MSSTARTSRRIAIFGAVALVSVAIQQKPAHKNPLVNLLAAKQQVFGVIAPAANAGRGGRGRANADTTAPRPAPKTPVELARDIIGYPPSDYVYVGSMEGNFDAGYTAFTPLAQALLDSATPAQRWAHPIAAKMSRIGTDTALAAQRIAKQLNLGVQTVMFVGVESAQELKHGLAMMRFKSKGGMRPDGDVGTAPAYWGMSEKEYRDKADLWPLNPNGELVNFTIVESKAGIDNIREIAAVPGIGVLFPGAGTMRNVYTKTDSAGNTVRDPDAWEAAVQKVLAACKEFKVACGFPVTEADVEMRMKQGFSVFVIQNWGEAGFRTVDLGRKLGGRQ